MSLDKEPIGQEEMPENEILGRHVSRDEIKAEQKRKKLEEKEERRRSRKQPKEKEPDENRVIVWVMIGILILVVGIVVTVLAISLREDPSEPAENSGIFEREDDMPEMSEEGIKGAIIRAYYTRDKRLALEMRLSNGLPTNHYLTTLEVEVRNGEDKVIATGYTDTINKITYKDTMTVSDYIKKKGFYVPANDYALFTFYISPEYVQIPNDDLDEISYTINTTGLLEDETVWSYTSGTTAGETTGGTTDGDTTTAAAATAD